MKSVALSALCILTLALWSLGCNTNKAATSENRTESKAEQPSSTAPRPTTGNPSTVDHQFITDAAKGNRAEVELGNMVASKAQTPAVKEFAEMMVKDHSEALTELQKLAQSKNVSIPEGVPEDAQTLEQKLSSESGAQLDKEYMAAMVKDHQKDVQEFKRASQTADDHDLKQWAGNMIPKLQEHLQKAQAINSKLGHGPSSQSGSRPGR